MVTDSLIRTSVQSTGIPKSYGIDKAKGQVQMQAQLVSTAPIKSKGDILGASRVKFEENGGFPKSRFSGDVG